MRVIHIFTVEITDQDEAAVVRASQNWAETAANNLATGEVLQDYEVILAP
jgi:hypothetical protein